jgi:asparagine N-glycosylation enzyme membrane subunit Stt3
MQFQGIQMEKLKQRVSINSVLGQISLDWPALLVGAGLFVIFLAGFAIVQYATPALAGNDGYYHMKMGYLMRTEGLTPDFPYLPFTILNAGAYYDHHMLYHLFLALFATVDPVVDGGYALTQGAKIASIIMPAFAFLAIWWLLRSNRVPYAALFSVALFAISEPFLYRMSMPRAQSLSLLLLVLGLHWLLQKKYRWLLPLGFIYVWAYNAFPLLLVLSGVYLIATLMLERRIVWPALIYPAIGIGVGLLINPYFPQNIEFILGHLAPKLGDSAIRVGNEWSPYRTWTLVENSAGALLAFLLGILALAWSEKRIRKESLVALGMAVLFGYMLFESRRFVEYFPPFALIFFALSVTPLFAEWQEEWGEKRPFLFRLAPIFLTLLLIYPLYLSLSDTRALMARSKPADEYADAVIWLHENAPAGTQIFQTDWDDFTRLFFYNSNAVYTAGLDPTFMELQDADLFDEWVDITRGRVENPGEIIRTRFNAAYVFSDLRHDDFMDEAAADPALNEVYRDDYAVIYEVVGE